MGQTCCSGSAENDQMNMTMSRGEASDTYSQGIMHQASKHGFQLSAQSVDTRSDMTYTSILKIQKDKSHERSPARSASSGDDEEFGYLQEIL